MRWWWIVLAVLAAVALFVLGRVSAGWGASDAHGDHAVAGPERREPTLWTCPMHPEVKLPEFGPCPKCGMDLVPLERGEDDPGPRRLVLSPAAVALAEVETAPVERHYLTMPVRMVGKVDYDETRIRTIAARVSGRLDRLYVDYTGIPVKKRDHLVWLFSPELLTAQQELIEAKKRLAATAGEPSEFLADSNRRGYESAREKLMLLGLTADQVDEIEARGTAEDHMLIRSPTEGVVIQKSVNEGDYVDEGTAIYRIADLSRLWILLDAYEQDLPWIRYGQTVSVTAEAIPGEAFEGRISFIAPAVDDKTRTVPVRVNVDNPAGRLKPGMFVRAVVRSKIGGAGRVLEPRLAGKWISPMHPEIVKDEPGTCDVCGMDLVPAESLGFVTGVDAVEPLVVPASAVLVTGTRAVVYVRVPDAKRPTFEGREVVLGPRAGDSYIVRSGLAEGEEVVVQGAFRIDSSMQIRAKPSMMSMPAESRVEADPEVAAFLDVLGPVYDRYFAVQQALAADDAAASASAAAGLAAAVEAVEVDPPRAVATAWSELAAAVAPDDDTIEARRTRFDRISSALLELHAKVGHPGDAPIYRAHCPMAFDDRGADWLQRDRTIANPYFGARMLRCGTIEAELEPAGERR